MIESWFVERFNSAPLKSGAREVGTGTAQPVLRERGPKAELSI